MGEVTAFRDKTFQQRYARMGDEAELQCTTVLEGLGVKHTRFGFQRPPFSIQLLPSVVRYSPDYVAADRFIEAQGLGRDGLVKIKRDKLEALHWWGRELPVDMFFWWSTRKKWALVPLADLTAAVDDPARSQLQFFDNSKAAFFVPAEGLGVWRKADDHAA